MATSRTAQLQQAASLPINIILLGDPAAGKATQSEFLVKKYKLYDFDMGKELTALRIKNQSADAVLKNNYDKGKLTPTKIVREILRSTIQNVPATQGILFDGHPKMLGEAQLVHKLLKQSHRLKPVVIYLSIPLEETVKRIHSRKGYFNGKFGKRSDDSDTALKNRTRYYRINIAQVIEFFKQHYNFVKISGMGSVAEVHKEMMKALTELNSK